MKVRLSLLSLALGLMVPASSRAQVLWTGLLDASLNNTLNWTGGSPTNADLLFGATIQPLITVNSSISVNSLTFSGLSPAYSFSTPNGSVLTIGSGGIVVGSQASNAVDFTAGLPLKLGASQTWNVDGVLNVAGTVSSATGTTTILTKTGAGTLSLSGSNTFTGGLVVQNGTLLISSSSAVSGSTITSSPTGVGALTLAANTTFGATRPALTLANEVSLANGVTLLSGSSVDGSAGLNLTGTVRTATNNVLVKLSGTSPLTFSGLLDGPANSVLRFQSSGELGNDSASLNGTTSANIASLVADNSVVYFTTAAALPATVAVKAINGGYVSVAATTVNSALPASTLLGAITDRSTFAGTFGFDTKMGAAAPHVYSENLDFSQFTNVAFNLGSTTEAVLTGTITPPITGGTATYRFGSGGGDLFVQSNLTDPVDPVTSAPVAAAVVVSRTLGQAAEKVVFSGVNTYTGTTTTGGVSSGLRVDNAMAVLDSAQALPTGATFSLGANAYVGYTESAAFTSFANFLSRLAPAGSAGTSVFGLDSHAYLQDKINSGSAFQSSSQRVFSGVVDLSSLTDGFLGSLSHVRVTGDIRAPSSHILNLTGVDGGRLTITSTLSPTNSNGSANISSVTVGYPNGAGLNTLGTGEVELAGASTYTGGTTLQSGALIVSNSSTVSGSTITSGPIGTGSLAVTASDSPVILASNVAAGATLYNPIALTGSLQLGLIDATTASAGTFDSNLLILNGVISGSGALNVYGKVILDGTNTYSGGTTVHAGGLIFADTAALPALPLLFALKSDAGAYIGLASNPLLTLQTSFIGRFDPANTKGIIGFDTLDATTTVFADPISLVAFTSPTVRLGSATSAKLSGTITPAGTTYRFGGGGGTLEVSSNLSGGGFDVDVTSGVGTSLALRLSGANTFTGNASVNNSSLVFAVSAIPALSSFTLDATGYIGTEDAGFDANFSRYLDHFPTSLDHGIIGFDTDPTLAPRTITTTLNLGSFTSATPNFYIGSSTSVIFGAASTITLPANATAYRFTGYRGGRLQVDTILSGAKGLVIGDPASAMTQESPDGVVSSVVLNAANTFTNGTTLYAGNLYLGTSSVGTTPITSGPLGSGALTVASNQFSGRPALRVLSAPITLANAIVLNSSLDVGSDLTLTGTISGSGALRKVDAGTLTLSGNNSWSGGMLINEGGVIFTGNSSVGNGSLSLGSSFASTATFLSAAPAIKSLSGQNSGNQLVLANNSALSITQNGTSQFLGIISGTGAQLNIQALNPGSTAQLTLGGANTYTGGTTIGNGVVMIASNNAALGSTGTVTLNQGTLAVSSGITTSFNGSTHPLVINGGTLRGTGTLSFDTSLNVAGGTSGAVVLAPGLQQPGKLNFNFTSGATLILNSGGSYRWRLTDTQNTTTGWDTIAVNGGVNLAATALAPFNFTIATVGSDGSAGEAGHFDVYSSYSWTLISATSFTGFDLAKFNLDTTGFVNSTLDGTFSLALNGTGTSLMLNYTAAAIPEPSTWALMISGAATLAVTSLRRRRRS